MYTSWISQKISRKLISGLAAIILAASLCFLILLTWLYHERLKADRAEASTQVNLLLQASLENAMLKRDLPGLEEIVDRLGRQEKIRRVMIVNPDREVRFSSDKALLNKVLEPAQLTGCKNCPQEGGLPSTISSFALAGQGGQVMRTANPISNKPPCQVCHGSISDHPLNGVLIVDYEAKALIWQALLGGAGLAAAGGAVTLLALLGVWLFLKRAIVRPVQDLNSASNRLAKGDLSVRIACESGDELAMLCRSFNDMASRLELYLEDINAHDEFLQELIDSVPDGIRVIDEEFHVIMANKAFCDQQGLELGAVEGGFCYASSHGRTEPCPSSLITCPLHEISKNGRPVKLMHQHVRPDGSRYHVEISAAPLTLRRGGQERRFIVEAIRDLEQQIKVTQEQRLSELGQLATGVAHEIHNPLASVRLGLQALLRQQDGERTDEEVNRYLRQVDGEVDKCIEVTRKLLNLSMPPTDYVQLVSLSQVIRDIVSLLKYEFEKSGVRLILDLDERGLRILSTDSDMRMLVLNLMQNAVHAMPDGGELTVIGKERDGRIELTFGDSGVGIAADDLQHIFDPFFSRRADSSSGTGIGLTICKSIIERFGGSIKVDSQPGEGAVFTVLLPSAEASEQ